MTSYQLNDESFLIICRKSEVMVCSHRDSSIWCATGRAAELLRLFARGEVVALTKNNLVNQLLDLGIIENTQLRSSVEFMVEGLFDLYLLEETETDLSAFFGLSQMPASVESEPAIQFPIKIYLS